MADPHDIVLAEHMADQYNAINGLPDQPYTYGETVLYYDGPRLFWFTTASQQTFLVESAAETEDEYTELAVLLDPQALGGYLRGEQPLREAWTNASPEDVYLIHYPADDDAEIWVEKAPNPLAEDLLPAPDARL